MAQIKVSQGQNLQAAVDAAQPGDVVVIESGATFVTPGVEEPALVLKRKNPPDNPVTITTNKEIPKFRGLRAADIQQLALPKLISNTSTPALEVTAGAQGYKLIGIEVVNDSRGKQVVNNGLVFVGVPAGWKSPQVTLATVPRDIEFDRCWVHSEEDGTDLDVATCLRGFLVAAANLTIRDSRVAGFRTFAPGVEFGQSTQAVLIERGPGPYTIIDNFLEAWFTSIFTGGGWQWVVNEATIEPGPTLSSAKLSNISNLHVGDLIAFKVTGQEGAYQVAKVVDINGNVIKYEPQPGLGGTGGNPLRIAPDNPGRAVWNGDRPRGVTIARNIFWKNPVVGAQAGARGYFGKGHMEFKTVENALVEGNLFHGFGAGFTITSRNQPYETESGSNPWATVKHVLFRNNVWRSSSAAGSGAVIGIQLTDNMATTEPGEDVTFDNCLFEDLGSPLLAIAGAKDVVFRHCTAVGGAPAGEVNMVFGHSESNPGFRLENCLLQNNEYGLNCTLGSTEACYPSAKLVGNVIVDNRSPQRKQDGPLPQRYPNNLIADSFGALKLAGGRLTADSPFKRKGSDGKDPGVDMDALEAGLLPGPVTPQPQPAPPQPQPVEPPKPVPTPPPTPAPVISIRKVAWPKTEGAQNDVVAVQWKDRFRFKRNLTGNWAEFEQVV